MFKRIINKLGNILPDFISKWLVYIPFKFRHGNKVYTRFQKKITESSNWSESDLEEYIVNHFRIIFKQSKRFKFYRDKYKKSGVLNLEINSVKDIEKIPLLTKSEIRDNINQFTGYYSQNTGGTSGNPIALYLDKNAWAREWVHYHYIWRKVGYKYTDVKFFFRGMNINDHFLKFDFQHNVYIVNIFKDPIEHFDEFFKTFIKTGVKYFQGYPSAIYDFLKKIENVISLEQKEILKTQIKYCLFSSEYPTPQIVNYIRDKWGFNFISCYGHSEICVLAATEINKLDYFPFHTYGYVEVESNKLIGTSYHNLDMPLIRYDTGDLVRGDKYKNGILRSFKIKEGRTGDFIYDKNNSPISLTGMFFGRHHKIYNFIDYIQVYQESKGKATLFITTHDQKKIDAPSLIDLDNIDLNFDIVYLKEPIRTNAGKVPLKIIRLPELKNIIVKPDDAL